MKCLHKRTQSLAQKWQRDPASYYYEASKVIITQPIEKPRSSSVKESNNMVSGKSLTQSFRAVIAVARSWEFL